MSAHLAEAFSAVAARMPERIALREEGGAQTFWQVESRVRCAATSLREGGVRPGDRVVLALGNSSAFIVALFAVVSVGAIAVPVNPAYTERELAYILGDCRPIAVIAASNFARSFTAVPLLLCADEVCPSGWQPLEGARAEVAALAEGNPGSTALILYTSGTTGRPKGAMLTHENLWANARDVAEFMGMTAADRVLSALPMFHAFALTVAVLAPLFQGGALLIAPQFSPRVVFSRALCEQATVFAGVPAMYSILLQAGDGHEKSLASLRLAISGGSSLPASVLRDFEEMFHVRVSEGYGLSEASPVCFFNPLGRPAKAGSIGVAVPHVQAKLIDGDGCPAAFGEAGELLVKGPNVMAGYWERSAETAAAFAGDWLRTGDIARFDEEGFCYILDRKKRVLFVGGFSVYPREIEEVLLLHPAVRDAAVCGLPGGAKGDRVVALFQRDRLLEEGELRSWCERALVSYKVPSSFCEVPSIPRNATGKVDLALVRSLAAQSVQASAFPVEHRRVQPI